MASARRRKDCFTSFLFVLPLLILFLVFFAYPIIYNIVISFYDWNGISVEKFYYDCSFNYSHSVRAWTHAGFVFYQKNKVFWILQNPFLSSCNLYFNHCRYRVFQDF